MYWAGCIQRNNLSLKLENGGQNLGDYGKVEARNDREKGLDNRNELAEESASDLDTEPNEAHECGHDVSDKAKDASDLERANSLEDDGDNGTNDIEEGGIDLSDSGEAEDLALKSENTINGVGGEGLNKSDGLSKVALDLSEDRGDSNDNSGKLRVGGDDSVQLIVERLDLDKETIEDARKAVDTASRIACTIDKILNIARLDLVSRQGRGCVLIDSENVVDVDTRNNLLHNSEDESAFGSQVGNSRDVNAGDIRVLDVGDLGEDIGYRKTGDCRDGVQKSKIK